MEKTDKIPNRLYKYRSFSYQILDMLVTDRIFFADPSTFNDPLDTRPSLNADIDSEGLERVLTELVKQRENGEMTAAAKTLKYRGQKTVEHIFRQSRHHAERLIDNIRYDANNPGYEEHEVDEPYHMLLSKYVESELLSRYDRGIFSLAQRANCPLMWSHYGDQHSGICVGYSVPTDATTSVHKMKYGGSRLVEASKIAAMLNGDKAARQEVDRVVLLKKAQDWRYEKEWRVIGQRGKQDSILELEEVIFGMRCDLSVRYAVVKALEGRSRKVKFYDIRQKNHDGFLLEKYTLNIGELAAEFPRRTISASEAFSSLPISETE